MASFQIIGKKFTPDEFDQYCASLKNQAWVDKIVLHNTASPRLSQRENGELTKTHIQNLKTYYEQKGWNGGPHLFVDATGIWVFNPLDRPGVHSPSYNRTAWGVEMLGDFSIESFTVGLGADVAQNSVRAIAALAKLKKWPDLNDGRLILHKEDPRTTHNCPGKYVVKADFIARVNDLISQRPFTVECEGKVIPGAYVSQDGISYAPIRRLAEALGFTVKFDQEQNHVTISK